MAEEVLFNIMLMEVDKDGSQVVEVLYRRMPARGDMDKVHSYIMEVSTLIEKEVAKCIMVEVFNTFHRVEVFNTILEVGD